MGNIKSPQKNCRYREYHVQETEDVEHQYVQMYCTTNHFPPLSFCGQHKKTHGVSGLGKYYNMSFDTKLGYGTCAIRCIPCACTQCTPMLDKTWSTGGSSYQQPQYQLVKYFTDWPLLGYFNN